MTRRRRAARDRRAASSAAFPSPTCAGELNRFPSPTCAEGFTGFPSPACGAGSGWGCSTLDGGRVLLTLITDQYLVAELTPDRLVELGESRLETDLRDVPGPWQGDLVGALHRSRSGGEDDDAIGERDRFLEVVGDEDHRCRRRGPERQELVLHQRPRLHVERRERFVHEQNARTVDQALRETDAFAHTARKLMRVAILETGQPNAGDPLSRSDAGLGGGRAMVAGTRRDVAQHRLPGEDGIALENVADAIGNALDRAAFDPDLARAGGLQARNQSERRRFAAAGRPDHGAELAVGDLKREVS